MQTFPPEVNIWGDQVEAGLIGAEGEGFSNPEASVPEASPDISAVS